VASQAIARQLGNRDGMSFGEIRNWMAALGDSGWLDQPHTRRGGTPSPKAFVFYVEQLNGIDSGTSCDLGVRADAGPAGPIEDASPV